MELKGVIFLVDMVVTVVEQVDAMVVQEVIVVVQMLLVKLVVKVQFVLFGQEMRDNSLQLEQVMSRVG